MLSQPFDLERRVDNNINNPSQEDVANHTTPHQEEEEIISHIPPISPPPRLDSEPPKSIHPDPYKPSAPFPK